MKKYVAQFADNELIFECSEVVEDYIYSAACHSVARYVVTRPELMKEVYIYFDYDEEKIAEFESLIPMHQIEELGEVFYEDNNWIFVDDYIE